jgi:murein DD-endopeptidase MepM/ murein hydrolase activator NlpD
MRRSGAGIISLLFLLFFLFLRQVEAEDYSHTLKKGETLYQIARRYHVPLDYLLETNGIIDPSRVRAGTVLRVPRIHVVRKGETLFSIARQYGVSLDTLVAVNEVRDTSRLTVGSQLFIPLATAGAGGGPTTGKGAPAAGRAGAPTDGQAPAKTPEAPSAVSAAAPGFWPHPGPRELLQGRLAGIVIRGVVGDSVRSVCAGQVVWVGPYRGFGKVAFVESSEGYVYVYAGNERILVEVGDRVSRGMEIGRLGKSPHQGGAQLIFMVYHDGRPIDPQGAPRT